jgi:hypothetical protein
MILSNKFDKITIECFREIRANAMGMVEKHLIWWYMRFLGSDFIIFGLKVFWGIKFWVTFLIRNHFNFQFDFLTIVIYYKLFAFGAIVLSTLGPTTWAALVFIRFNTNYGLINPMIFYFFSILQCCSSDDHL